MLKTVDSIRNGFFSNGDTGMFRTLAESLMDPNDPYLLLKDFEDYVHCHEEVSKEFADKETWRRKSILNVARIGKFSTDRTMREYSEDIWGVKIED